MRGTLCQTASTTRASGLVGLVANSCILAVLSSNAFLNGTISVNIVTTVDEKGGLCLAHGLVNFHPPEVGVDSPALTAYAQRGNTPRYCTYGAPESTTASANC